MPKIQVQDGSLMTTRFGDDVHVEIPKGGRIEIVPTRDHTDVSLRDHKGAKVRDFRLPREAKR